MTSKKAILPVVFLLIVVSLALIIRWLVVSRSTNASNACVNNLRQLVAVKAQWASENHKASEAIPTWKELRPYISTDPTCPGDGIYTPGRVGALPTCSIGGRAHSLPTD